MSKVEIYTWTFCPFCVQAKELLEMKNISYTEYNIDKNEDKKKELYEKTNQNTVPFIFINNQFIGGFTELEQMNQAGELDSL